MILPAPLGLHGGHDRLGHEERALEVERLLRIPVLLRDLLDRLGREDACVVHQDVHRAEGVDHLPRQTLAVGDHADVGHERLGLAAGGLDFGNHRLGALAPGVADHGDGGALPPVTPRNAGADAAR